MIEIRVAKYIDTQFEKEFFDFGFHGKVIDDRTRFSASEVQRASKSSFDFFYEQDTFSVRLNNVEIPCESLDENPFPKLDNRKVLIDATSLDVPELALLFDHLCSFKFIDFYIFYFEPEEYTKDIRYLENNDFSLSDNILGFENSGIPIVSGVVEDSDDKVFVIFAGFESSRLMSACEIYDIR